MSTDFAQQEVTKRQTQEIDSDAFEGVTLEYRIDLKGINKDLETLSAEERVDYAIRYHAPYLVLSSSFGAQAAVLLHMVSQRWPEVPVIFLDSEEHFPETYAYVDALQEKLNLNLKVYRAETSLAWQLARHGNYWEQGQEGLDRHHEANKILPFRQALQDHEATAWISGLRREQSETRKDLPFATLQANCMKFHPIADWTKADVEAYLDRFDLPRHALVEKGYVSIGDVHTTLPWREGMREEDTRHLGLKRECGLHQGGGI